MSMNSTPSSERVHIGFFGLRNAGKSSLVNAVTGQNLAVVSEVKGTTTDPVKKAMELLPLGPVLIIDTPGIDDVGELGEMRIKKAREILAKTDIAVLVAECGKPLSNPEKELLSEFKARSLPYIIARTKSDLAESGIKPADDEIFVSSLSGFGITELKDRLAALKRPENSKKIVSDRLCPGDIAVLVIPIDAAAPKGRLILPQQQTIRDLLDNHCTAVCCQVGELKNTLEVLGDKAKIVITDSQAFGEVSRTVPENILLTSFSILFARYKGDLKALLKGADKLKKLGDGDKVLISEGCTHHRQCGDIGSQKMPRWIEEFCGHKPEFSFSSGGEFPQDLSGYSLVVHCGGCMLNEAEMKHRTEMCENSEVPIVNYGVAIAHMHGILRRSLSPFPDMQKYISD